MSGYSTAYFITYNLGGDTQNRLFKYGVEQICDNFDNTFDNTFDHTFNRIFEKRDTLFNVSCVVHTKFLISFGFLFGGFTFV